MKGQEEVKDQPMANEGSINNNLSPQIQKPAQMAEEDAAMDEDI